MRRFFSFSPFRSVSSPEVPVSESTPLGNIAHLPPRLLRILPKLPIFAGIPPKELRKILSDLEWFSLPGGWTLMRRGQEGNSLYAVTAGRLGLFVPDLSDEEEMRGQILPGETVGELALLSGEERAATLVALRDTEVLRLTAPVFNRLAERHPIVMSNLARLMAARLKHTLYGGREAHFLTGVPKTISILPALPSVPCAEIGEKLMEAFARIGHTVTLVNRSHQEKSSEWFHALEADYDHVIYMGDGEAGRWSRLCQRQADCVVIVAGADTPPPPRLPLDSLLDKERKQRLELVVLHDGSSNSGSGASPWRARYAPDTHHNIRLGREEDLHRLARHFAGRGVGLVLAGGGARGFAHLGVLRALRESNITIDHVGGTSMGAIVAAGLALEWTPEELEERMWNSFVKSNPINDVTVPVISLYRGRKVLKLLKENFGEARIEEAWLNFFCVSSNLTTGKEHVSRDGRFWQALRSSIAIPGLLPPVLRNGEVLVDGAVINNFPADIMDELMPGPIIGVDVEAHHPFGPGPDKYGPRPFWGILGETLKGGPGIVSLLLRAGTVNSEAQTRQSHSKVDLLFEPHLENIRITSWKAYDKIIEAGYVHAREVLDRMGGAMPWERPARRPPIPRP